MIGSRPVENRTGFKILETMRHHAPESSSALGQTPGLLGVVLGVVDGDGAWTGVVKRGQSMVRCG